MPAHSLSLKSKLSLFTALLFVSTVMVLAFKLEREVRSEFEAALTAHQFSRVQRIAESLDNATRDRLANLAETAKAVKPQWVASPARLSQFLAEGNLHQRAFGGGLRVVSAEGNTLALSPQFGATDELDFTQREFFRKVIRLGIPAIDAPSRDGIDRQPLLLMGAPIRDADGRVTAALVGSVRILGDDMFAGVMAGRLRTEESVHIISLKDQLYIASTNAALVLQSLPANGGGMLGRYREGNEGSGVGPGPKGEEELTSARRMRTAGWMVVASMPTAIAFESINSIRDKIYFGATLSSLIIPILLWLYLHGQLTPLSRAAKTLDEMTQGKMPLQPLLAEGSKEIQRLLHSFNLLQSHINQQKNSLNESAEKLRLSARVFESSCESIVIADASMRIVSVNRAFTEMTGYVADEVAGHSLQLLGDEQGDEEFTAMIGQHLRHADHWQGEVRHRRRGGETYPAWLHVSVIRDADRRPGHYVFGFLDISDRKRAEERIEYMAFHDPLTGLPNRRLAMERLELAIALAERSGGRTALMFLDLDNFKTINDSFGHAIGDLLLQAVASRLMLCIRDSDTICRQGGDEFLIVLGNVPDTDGITTVTNKILEALTPTFNIEGNELSTSSSIGIAVFPDDGRDIDTLLKRADTAMYHAKETGRNAYSFFTEQMNIDAVEHQRVRVGLLHAMERGEFRLHYQPQIDLSSGRVIGAEALIRWNHPERGLLSPEHFIAIAEESGLIVPIGAWVLREACRQAAAWRKTGLPQLVIAVNVSAIQFKRGDIEACVRQALEESGLPPHCLELELTESILIHDTDQMLDTVQRLKALGVMLSIDDFGTGYSSLSYLTRFKVDKLKIDRSFVHDIEKQPGNASMVKAIIQMALSLNLKTIAEGVEDEELVGFLRRQHCEEAQGYYYSRPLPAIEFAHYLALARARDGMRVA